MREEPAAALGDLAGFEAAVEGGADEGVGAEYAHENGDGDIADEIDGHG